MRCTRTVARIGTTLLCWFRVAPENSVIVDGIIFYPGIDQTSERSGRWTVDEDSKLKDVFQKHGDKGWVTIAALVPGRTKSQCWHRWKYHLDPHRSTVREKEDGTLNKEPDLW
jgi:hypothetical protein